MWCNTTPQIVDNIKNATIFRSTKLILVELFVELVTIVKMIIPKISSIIAAPNIAVPERVFNLPSSCKVSTVILTEVAVNITPIKNS